MSKLGVWEDLTPEYRKQQDEAVRKDLMLQIAENGLLDVETLVAYINNVTLKVTVACAFRGWQEGSTHAMLDALKVMMLGPEGQTPSPNPYKPLMKQVFPNLEV